MSRPASLVVFTLGSRADTRRHRLLSPSASGLELGFRRACVANAFEAGRAAGLQLAVCSPEPLPEAPSDARWLRQEPGPFGERFEAAVEQGLRETNGPIVVVGSDVPALAVDLFRAALDGLAHDPDAVVVGPARDGGFYLLATARPLGSVFREVRWCGSVTRKTLLAALRRAGRPVVLLSPLHDLDRPADVEAWLAEGRPYPAMVRVWSDRLRAFLSARRRPLADRDPDPTLAPAFGSLRGRAPPLPATS
jgi:2-phospho-L-lactate guanylyltransferase (CobY/MobA/RfbA family)